MKGRAVGLLIVFVLSFVFSAVGAGVGFGLGKPIVDEAKASVNWPTVEGTVTESLLEESRSDGSTMYSAHVVYEYALDGGQLDSDRIWFGGNYSTSDRSEMSKVVRDYPVGRKVTVYYSPDNPAESVLLPGAYFSTYILFSVGMVFLAVGGILLLVFLCMLFFTGGRQITSKGDEEFGSQFGAGTSDDFSDPLRFHDE